MSSDEDFSIVTDKTLPQRLLSEDTVEGIKALIINCQKKYEQLLQEQKDLAAARDDSRNFADQCKKRCDKLAATMTRDQQSNKEQLDRETEKLGMLKREEGELMEEIQKVEEALKEEEATCNDLKQHTDVFNAVPERKLVFTGQTRPVGQAGADKMPKFEMKARIVFPMDGGTALVTYEEEVVAMNILQIRKHRVDLGEECRITLEARPVQLMVPSLVEIDSNVCPRRILISNLPKMETETMLNKLEIHFSKRKNGGGEVEECEMLHDSGTVVITFVENNIAKHLADKEYHEVEIQQNKHKVRVTPFLNGTITNLRTKMSECHRTVLLTGIPDIMERESMQDLLEIHFQKNCNGGGEIEAFLYNPLGEHISALFEDVSPDKSSF